ncbi:hypothetical protein TSUD_226960 [Trifolium subterraneum]|uniref:Pentacotripeptide-repeat region of PRORP domain-containing protein n=1 Tax=Trifolium subterraneum TaxID=3900 RepID=A0A2Z6N059_TRISU|nr:hypothetical protein TSUD_226960 [Trifolium subterraneum]
MQRLISFGRRHGRNYISGSSLSSSSSSSLKKDLIFRRLYAVAHASELPPCNSDSKDDFHIVMNILSNSAPSRCGHQLYSALNAAALDMTNLDKHFVLKAIETSCQTRLVYTPRVSPYDLIRYLKLVWKDNKDLITTPVVESLVSSICSFSTTTVPTQRPTKNDLLFLWDFLNRIARHHPPGLLNARILNTLIQSFSIMGGRGQGKAALEVFNKFQVFHCVPNHDTYYFTLQALLNTTTCTPDMIRQAASICQNMLLLLPHHHHHHDGGSSHHDQEYTQPPLSPEDDSEESDFQIALTSLGGIPRPYFEGCVCANLNLMDFNPLRQQLHHFVLKTIETSSQTKLIETRKVSPHNLIHFVKWAWRTSNNNKDLITTPVLESLVSAICDDSMDPYDVHLWKNDILFLWDLLKHIGHSHTGLLNTRILNQLLHWSEEKTALEVFHKFEVFQCVPNQDTYAFTLQLLLRTRLNMPHLAASICQKMLLHPETLLPDDSELLGKILSWFSKNNMTEEAYALYLAANEKRKTNPNWSPQLNRLLPLDMVRVLCSKKETVHLAFEMLNDIPEELTDVEDLLFKRLFSMHVAGALCWFKELEAAKQLILKPIANGQHPEMYAINIIITALVKAGEIRQVLEMVMLLESIVSDICYPPMFGLTCSDSMLHIRMILEEAKKKDYKLIIALLYHTLIVGCCRLRKFNDALKFLTQMKDFGVAQINVDEYHKSFHSVCLMHMDREMAKEQLAEMEPMDREMVNDQLSIMAAKDMYMIEQQLEEMYLNIRALF